MRAAKPTIGAVPGSDIAGPDWAPNHASAALSASLSKYSSSSASPGARNCRDSSLLPRAVARPPNAPIRFDPVGGAENAFMTCRLRSDQTRDESPVGVGVLCPACSFDGPAGCVEVAVKHDARPVGARGGRRERPRVTVDVAQSVRAESEFLDDAAVSDHEVCRRPPVHLVSGKSLDGRDGARREPCPSPEPRPTNPRVRGRRPIRARCVRSRRRRRREARSQRESTAEDCERPVVAGTKRNLRSTSRKPRRRYSRQARLSSSYTSGVDNRTLRSGRSTRR